MKCKKCGNDFKDHNADKMGEIIDGEFMCNSCLYNGEDAFQIYPIGYVRNNLKRGRGFGLKGSRHKPSRIELFSSQKPFLYKIEDEKKLVIVFYLHNKKSIKSTFRRGIDGKKVGVFSSRTPNRPSRIGITRIK
ncbi:MAG: hypothetical protein GF364_05945, partial [Candidatus Lokiarchaeota archaeon]|nr:hypothetical protein [Candidatus Lokiarchaeota archaeon]